MAEAPKPGTPSDYPPKNDGYSEISEPHLIPPGEWGISINADKEITPAERQKHLGELVTELHATGKADFDQRVASANPKDFLVHIKDYQPKPRPIIEDLLPIPELDSKAITDEPIPTAAAPAALEEGQVNNQMARIVTPPEAMPDPAAAEREALMKSKNAAALDAYQRKTAKPMGPDMSPEDLAAQGNASIQSPESKEKDRFTKSLDWLTLRAQKWDAVANKYGGEQMEKAFRGLGEWYNKQNKWAKMGIGITMGVGAGLTLPFSSVIGGAFVTGVVGQRVLGGLGRFITIEKNLQKAKEGTLRGWVVPKLSGYKWLAEQPESVRTAASIGLAAMYSTLFGASIGVAVHAISDEVVPLLGHLMGHGHEDAVRLTPRPISPAQGSMTPQQEMDHMTWAQMHPGQPYPGDAAAEANIHKALEGATPKPAGGAGSIPNYPRADFTEPTSNGPDLSIPHAETPVTAATGFMHHGPTIDDLRPDNTPAVGAEHAASATAAPHEAVHHAAHHVAHHPEGISLAERDALETKALNELQLAHPGVVSTPEEITAKMNELLAEHAKHVAHVEMLNAHRANLGLAPHPKPEFAPAQPTAAEPVQAPVQPAPAAAPVAPSVEHAVPAPAESAAPDLSHVGAQDAHYHAGNVAPVVETPHPAEATPTPAPEPVPNAGGVAQPESPTTHPVEPAPTSPVEAGAAPGTAEPPIPGHPEIQPNHFGLRIDGHVAGRFTDSQGNKIVFGGEGLTDATDAAKAWVAEDHKADIYFEFKVPRLLGLIPDVHHIGHAYWDTDTNQIKVDTDIDTPALRGLNLPGVDDLAHRVPKNG